MGNTNGSVQPEGSPQELPPNRRAVSLLKMIEFSKDPRTAMLDARDHLGDLFLLESMVLSGKIAGFCGPELLAAFDAKLADGSIVRENAMPPTIVELLGPILPTLDGDVHHKRKCAVHQVFGPEQLKVYQPVIRKIIQTEHAAWAARGGAISLSQLTRTMIFHLFLKILYNVDAKDDTYLHLFDKFIAGLRKSSKTTDREAIVCRKRLLSELIEPAVAAAKARVSNNEPAPCAFDYLVAKNELTDHELVTEGFHFMFAGFGGVQCLATNLITACATHSHVIDKILEVREQYKRKYDAEAQWSNFQDLGYVNSFILEVKRYYVAGPTQIYGRAAIDLEISTSGGVYKIPKGCLVAAGLEATNKHPDVWTDPNTFNPNRFNSFDLQANAYKFCPHSFGSVEHRRCAGEGLTTLILQSIVVSLFDFVWQMVPNQDYTLEVGNSTPTPLGQLLAIGFRRRSDKFNLYGFAGSHADWTFLNLPEASSLVGNGHVDLYDDARLDLWTRLMIKIIGNKQAAWNRPRAPTAINIPQFMKLLPKITLFNTNIEIATEDEDWPSQPWLEIQQSNFLRDHAPFVDNLEHTWLPGEDMERYVMTKVGHMWPRVNVHWNDRYSDRALELLAFNGLGQHLLEKLPEPSEDGSYYIISLNFMKALEVRAGFAKYGANAYFDRHGKVIKITRGDASYYPNDANWEYAKLCFRGSLQTKVTAVDHLLGIHATVANVMVIAARELLPPHHPLRRLIKPFTFRSVAINYGAGRALFWPKGMLQRAYALTDIGMKQTWDYGLANFKYETFPERVKRQNIDTVKLPFHEDGMEYWTIVRTLVNDYVDLYYKSDEKVTNDNDLKQFWTYLSTKLPFPLRELNLENIKDFISHFIFLVSSMHNHLGTIAEYVSDPAFCPSAWVEGELAGRPGNAVRLALIMTATGFAQPAITEDFSHVMLDNEAKEMCQKFTQKVKDQISVIDARNATPVLAAILTAASATVLCTDDILNDIDAKINSTASSVMDSCVQDVGVSMDTIDHNATTPAQLDAFAKSPNCEGYFSMCQNVYRNVDPPCYVYDTMTTKDIATSTFTEYVFYLRTGKDQKLIFQFVDNGAIIGGVVGGVVVIGIIVAFFVYRRMNAKKRQYDITLATANDTTSNGLIDFSAIAKGAINADFLTLDQLIGSGAFAEVWRGTFQGKPVAVKALLGSRTSNQGVQDFVNEIALMMTFDSPYIIGVVGASWTRPSDLKCVMEFMNMGDLKDYLCKHTRTTFPWSEKLLVLRSVVEGLVYLHSISVIHRDLKSRNILLDSKKGAKLADFGISKEDNQATMTVGVGTFRWMAPEVLQDSHYTVAADIYSLGMVLSEMDSHQIPYEEVKNPKTGQPLVDTAIIGAVLHGTLRPQFSSSCPSVIRELAEQCLQQDPLDRPTSFQISAMLKKLLHRNFSTDHIQYRFCLHCRDKMLCFIETY
ncbi:hypothetical protein THRCLA_00900 [Thraustotheca clavata]|uniref:Guanylate cyclase n=1 Tax=Thraustotheca clavata TaxID=74557 RepID=A0A1W0AA93_9STRA|nr:hypothetical protein THRCLA_00900 [Thraustotheca clavata]